MKMKWFVVFCCLIILILGGLLAAGRHFYQQDALEYQRLLAKAEVTRKRDIQTTTQSLVAQHEAEMLDIKTEIDDARWYVLQSELTIKALRRLFATEKDKSTSLYLSYHIERTTTIQLSAQLEREKENSAYLLAALQEANAKIIPPRPFKDKRELNEYLETYEPGLHFYGGAIFFLNDDRQAAVCVPAATHLMLDAFEHGFIIDTEIDEDNEHAVGKTIINGQYHFIEPQTKEVFRYLGGTKWKVGE